MEVDTRVHATCQTFEMLIIHAGTRCTATVHVNSLHVEQSYVRLGAETEAPHAATVSAEPKQEP